MSDLPLSVRARRTPASPIRRLSHLAAQARRREIHVHHLNIGQPDLPTPTDFFEGLQAYRQSVLAYDPSEGSARLRAAWAGYVNRTLGLATCAEEYLVTMGASEALVFVFMICCDPGDEVIVFDPTYANYIGFASITGVNLVPVLSRLDEGFALPPPESITDRLSPRTRAILLCSPNNPTGTVYDRGQLQMLLDLCREANLFLIVDETYRELVFDREPLSILQLAAGDPRVVVVDSLSKRFSLCGARIGLMHSTNAELHGKALNLAQARLAAPTLEQFAATHMIERLPQDYLAQVRTTYQERRDTLHALLCEIPGVATQLPSGAFYTVARLPVECAEDFAGYLLRDFSLDGATVFLAPAAGFYMGHGRGHNKVRIAYVLNTRDITGAMAILDAGLRAYSG